MNTSTVQTYKYTIVNWDPLGIVFFAFIALIIRFVTSIYLTSILKCTLHLLWTRHCIYFVFFCLLVTISLYLVSMKVWLRFVILILCRTETLGFLTAIRSSILLWTKIWLIFPIWNRIVLNILWTTTIHKSFLEPLSIKILNINIWVLIWLFALSLVRLLLFWI